MAFSPKIIPQPYSPSPFPVLPGTERLYIDRELRELARLFNTLRTTVIEIQDYLENPTP